MQYVKVKVRSGPEECSVEPASVQVLERAGVKLRCSGPPLSSKQEDPRDFWDYLMRHGDNWMWGGLVERHRDEDLTWLVKGLGKGAIEW